MVEGCFSCYAQGLLTAAIALCLSFVQLTHQLSMLSRLSDLPSQIFLVKVLHSHINAVLVLPWHRGSH